MFDNVRALNVEASNSNTHFWIIGTMATVPNIIRCKRGNIIIIFALSLPLVLGTGGIIVDYSNSVRIRTTQSSIADATALLVANADTVEAATQAYNLANSQLVSKLGNPINPGGYTVEGKWIDGSNYRVKITSTMKTALVHLLPGVANTIVISTATTVNRVAPIYETAPPTFSQISPEAADYNRIYIYCFSSDPARQKEADAGRRGITPIADNADPPTSYDMSKIPTCGNNEAPSYMLRNVRDARTNSKRWNETGSNTYNYYTDVTIDTGTRVQTMNLKGSNMGNGSIVDVVKYPMLETIVCDTQKDCTSKSAGGIIPNRQTGRKPLVAGTSCQEGKYLYYGWEDRPGGDQDYDDIRLVVNCPKQIKTSDKKIRIVE